MIEYWVDLMRKLLIWKFLILKDFEEFLLILVKRAGNKLFWWDLNKDIIEFSY